jgi:hypothetical protein
MAQIVLIVADVIAVNILVFGLYVPRHRRRDLVVAYLGVNVGVLAVATSLANVGTIGTGAGIGLGLGLFGVLSIIRLRSTELDQHEVAYYFSALALGLIGALPGTSPWLGGVLMALILVVIFIGDHRRMFRGYRRQVLVMDRAVLDEVALVAHLEQLLGARVHSASVQRVDLVNDTTVVDVRYTNAGRPRSGRGAHEAVGAAGTANAAGR